MKNYYLLLALSALSFHSKGQTITWSPAIDVAPNSYNNEHPRVAVDGDGEPLVIWGNSSSEHANFSRWNGASFTMPYTASGMMTVASQSWMGPDMAAHGDTVYAVFKQNPESDLNSHIYLIRSFDAGMSFAAPVQVDNIGDSLSRFPAVTTDENGHPIVAFMKFDPSFGDARWVVARSNDYGSTFGIDDKASGWTGGTVCDCCPGAITASGNDVAMMYRSNLSNIRDTWVGISNDGGTNFTNGWNADQNNWMLMMCPSSGPDGVIIGDTLYSVFMNGATGDNLVYWSKSALADLSAQPTAPISGMVMNLNSQNYPRMASYGNALAVIWKQNVSGADQLAIRFTGDINTGLPDYTLVDTDNITNADVALSNGAVHVVWEDNNTGTVRYRKGTFSALGVNETPTKVLTVHPNPSVGAWTITSDQNISDVELIDAQGAKVDVRVNQTPSGFEVSNIGLASGVYVLHVQVESEIQALRLIKD